MRKIFTILIITTLFAEEHAGYAGSFLENGASARSIAMANALTAGTELYYPAYFNPAGVASVVNRKALFTHQFLSLDRNQSTIGITLPLPPFGGISIGWVGAGVNNIQGRDLTGDKTQILSSSEDIFMLSFGVMPVDKLQIGGSVKLLQNQLPNLDGNISGSGLGFDFGAIYGISNNLNIAIIVKNVNAAYQWSNEIEENLNRTYQDNFPLQLRTGIEYQSNNILLVGDFGTYFNDTEYLDSNYRLGVEYSIYENYFIRGGYRSERFSFGIGMKQEQFDRIISFFDYAIVIENVSGLSHIISYAVNF